MIRHAESEHHLNGLTGGWTDTGLTDLGRAQAERLAARLGSDLTGVPVVLFASDLRRGTETAEQIAAALGVPVIPEPRLREHNNGWWLGLGCEALQRIWFGTPPTGITVLHSDEGADWRHRGIDRLGDITHLQGMTSMPPLVTFEM